MGWSRFGRTEMVGRGAGLLTGLDKLAALNRLLTPANQDVARQPPVDGPSVVWPVYRCPDDPAGRKK